MKKILLVDDEVNICKFLKKYFERRQFEVAMAYSGREALERMALFHPDIVLLDVRMPGMDGLEVLKNIKTLYPKTKVIMVTGEDSQEKGEEAKRLGADNYITKPLSLEYLEKDVQDKIDILTKVS